MNTTLTTKLYLVAARSKKTGNHFTFISTSDFANANDVAVLKVIDFECDIEQSEAEIDAMLDALNEDRIVELRKELAMLEGETITDKDYPEVI